MFKEMHVGRYAGPTSGLRIGHLGTCTISESMAQSIGLDESMRVTVAHDGHGTVALKFGESGHRALKPMPNGAYLFRVKRLVSDHGLKGDFEVSCVREDGEDYYVLEGKGK